MCKSISLVMMGGYTLDESSYCVLELFIQFDPHLELLKLPNICFNLEISLTKRYDLEVELFCRTLIYVTTLCSYSKDSVFRK